MEMRLHVNATTTPRTRAYIQASTQSVASLAAELGINETTVRRWKNRTTTQDFSHTPKRLAISLTPIEDDIVCTLRKNLALPLDDLVEVMKRCVNAKLSRSAIHRCLVRHALNRTAVPEGRKAGQFEACPFGFVHVDLKHLPPLGGVKSYVFVAIERTTRFVFAKIITRRDGQTVAACFAAFLKAFGHPVHTVLSDNGSQFTDRFGGVRWRPRYAPTGCHPFDRLCAAHGITHKLTRPFTPQTNGMVERFNRRLAEAIRAKASVSSNGGRNKFETPAQREAFIYALVQDYNRTRLRCLGYLAPLQALANQTGDNTHAGIQVNEIVLL